MFGECRFLGMFLFDRFLVFSEPSIEFPFSLPDVEFVGNLCTKWNKLHRALDLLERAGSLGLRKQAADSLVWL